MHLPTLCSIIFLKKKNKKIFGRESYESSHHVHISTFFLFLSSPNVLVLSPGSFSPQNMNNTSLYKHDKNIQVGNFPLF